MCGPKIGNMFIFTAMVPRYIHYKLSKICLLGGLFFLMGFSHPFYVSVTHIEHNLKEQSLEVSIKLFSDDFEAALKHEFNKPVNILLPANKKEVDNLIASYLRRHLHVKVDDKPVSLQYLGYERDEEGVICYLEATGITQLRKLTVFNDLIYETHAGQASIIRSSVNNIEKNTRMVNPVNQAELYF